MKKRVAFILHNAQCGGAESVLIRLANELPRRKFQPVLIFVDKRGALAKTVASDVSIISLERQRISRALHGLLREILRVRPDVLVSSISHLNLAVLLLKPLIPRKTSLFVRESNLISIALAANKRFPLFVTLIRKLYPKANKVICLGNAMKRDLTDFFRIPESKIATIGNPVDIDRIRRLAIDSCNPYEENRMNLLAVGSLSHQKGFDILVEAIALTVPDLPTLHLTILGEGPLREELGLSIAEKGLSNHITLAGFKENPYPYFYHADRFVLSSRYEGLPNVVLEAIALATEVIAFDSPGCIRDIIGDPSLGTLVTPCTADALAQAILRSCTRADTHITPILPEKFTLTKVIRQYQALFEDG